MDNRVVVDPLALTDKTSQLLLGYIKRRLENGRLLVRDQKYLFNFHSFTLAYDLLIREKSPGNWRVDVIAKEGGHQTRWGHLYSVLGVLQVPHEEGSAFVIHRKNKRLIYIKNKDGWHEFDLMQRCPHLGARGFFAKIPSIVSLRKPPGEPLMSVLNRDRRSVFISTDERYRMTIECLRGLRNQIHRAEICLKNIKPDTIFYDHETCQFNFIDFDISKLLNDKSDVRSRGNVVFSAPEEFTSTRTKKPVTAREYTARVGMMSLTDTKSDIYSVARVLGLIWRDVDPIFTDAYHEATIMHKRIECRWRPQFKLFQNIENLSQHEKSKIAQQLHHMTLLDKDRRPDLQACIESFQAMYLDFQLRHLPVKLHDDVKVSHELARQLSKALESLRDANAIVATCTQAIEMLPDNDISIQQFILTLNVICLKGLSLKSELISKIAAVYAMYDCYKHSLEDLRTNASRLHQHTQANEISAILGATDKQCDSIDGVANAVHHLQCKLFKLCEGDANSNEKKRANPRMN